MKILASSHDCFYRDEKGAARPMQREQQLLMMPG